MKHYKYLNEDGSTMLTVECSNPFITIIPPGKTLADAVPIDAEEYNKHKRQVEKLAANYVDPKQKEMDELKKELADIKKSLKAK